MAIVDYYATLTRRRVTVTGGAFPTESATDTTFQGAINQANAKEVQQAMQFNIEADFKMYCDVTEDINHNDIIIDDGKKYRVVGSNKNTMKRNHHFKIMLKYIGIDNG